MKDEIIKTKEIFDKPDWALYQTEDKNGVVYDVCEHAYAHPNEKWLEKYNLKTGRDFSLHKCKCGCCSKFVRDVKAGKFTEEEDGSSLSLLARKKVILK